MKLALFNLSSYRLLSIFLLYDVFAVFDEVSAHTTLSKTLIVDILGVWILVSVVKNLGLLHIHLLPFLS